MRLIITTKPPGAAALLRAVRSGRLVTLKPMPDYVHPTKPNYTFPIGTSTTVILGCKLIR